MMIHPSYKEMISKINEGQDMDEAPLVTSRYSIVIAAARRARQLIAGDEPMVVNRDNEKALSTAIKELYEDKVHILRNDAPADTADPEEAFSGEAADEAEDAGMEEPEQEAFSETDGGQEDALTEEAEEENE